MGVFAFVVLGQEKKDEVVGVVAVVEDEGQTEELLGGEEFEAREVADVERVGPEQLAESGIDVVIDDERFDDAADEAVEAVEDKAVLS